MTAAWIAAVMMFQSVCLPAQAQWAKVDVKEQKTPTSTWVLLGVGSALVLTGIIILIAKTSKKKQVKIRDLSYDQSYATPSPDKVGLFKPTPVDSENFTPAPNQFSGYILKRLNFTSEIRLNVPSQDMSAGDIGKTGH